MVGGNLQIRGESVHNIEELIMNPAYEVMKVVAKLTEIRLSSGKKYSRLLLRTKNCIN